MSTVQAATILYPLGGETIVSPSMTIQWSAPGTLDSASRPVFFEVYFTDDFREDAEPNWILLASLPSSINEYLWRIDRSINSTRCRIAIRCRNSVGDLGAMSVSHATFTIRRGYLPVPQIITPASGGRYDVFMSIMVIDTSVPKRRYFHLSYACPSLGIERTTIAPMVPVSAIPYQWNTSSLEAADDYILFAMSVERDNTPSEVATVKDIAIRHEGFVLIDTLPPETSITIAGDALFTNDPNITVNVYAYDAATGVHSFQIKELDDEGADVAAGAAQGPKQASLYTLSSDDGNKIVSLLSQDFGCNRNLLGGDDNYRVFVNAMTPASGETADFCAATHDTGVVVYVVTDGTRKALYRIATFPTILLTFTSHPKAVEVFEDEVYVSLRDSDNLGHIVKYTGSGTTTIYDFVTEDEFAVDMAVFNGSLFWGTNYGRLMGYDGVEVTETVNNKALTLLQITGGVPVKKLTACSAAIYIALEDTTTIYVYDGSGLTGMRT